MGIEYDVGNKSMRERTRIEDYYKFFQSVKTEMVKPVSRGDHDVSFYPSRLDLQHMGLYTPLFLVYRLRDNSDSLYDQFVHGLKASLAKVLGLFYPAAGVVVKTSNPHTPQMFICDDRGAPFIEAYKDEVMDHIVKGYEPVTPLSGWEAVGLFSDKPYQDATELGTPSLFVQVTRFKCGGVTIAVSYSHILADLTGIMLLMRAWADIACTGQTTIVPQIDRRVLSPRYATESEPTAPLQLTGEEKMKVWKSLHTDVALKVLHIKSEKIQKVKQAALEDGFLVSTMDCVCAHFWRCVSRYHANAGVTDTTFFCTMVEGRAKMGGILTPHYFGNVVAPAFLPNVPASDILTKPLGYAASLIRKSIKDVSQDNFWKVINSTSTRNSASLRRDHNLGISVWAGVGLYDLDFGQGKPVCFKMNMLPEMYKKGQSFILPSDSSPGCFDILFYSAPQTIEQLWADPELTSLS